MFKRNTRLNQIALAVGAVALLATGCASSGSSTGAAATADTSSLESTIAQQKQAVADRDSRIAELERKLESQPMPAVSSAPPVRTTGGGDLLPPAKPGECYARVFVPPTYATETETVLKRAASSRVEIVPARYEAGEERILVKEASSRLEVVPATYGYVEEQVLVKPASKRLQKVPAQYETVTEQILVKPAHTVWKKGRGPIERLDQGTGEIMCLIEVPAQYRTVSKRVEKSPATTRELEIPAEYRTVKKRVVKTPASTRTVEIPAEYKTVKIRKIASPPQENRVEIPAEYQDVTRRKLVTDGRLEWREILCETNVTRDVVVRLQRALDTAGHSPGTIDGAYGPDTLRAVTAYQKEKGLPSGQLTFATLKALGIAAR